LTFSYTQYDEETTLREGEMPQSAHFVDTGFCASLVEPGKEYQVGSLPVTTLDEYLGNDPATFIKFEIEGSEVDALNGAIRTITKNRPKLALSVYHRPQDLHLIINFVKDLKLDYRMAIRAHNPQVPDAIVLYCW
jgi:hypothetical protein